MTPLNLSKLIRATAKDAGVTEPQTAVVLEAFLGLLEASLTSGVEVKLHHFGTFHFKTMPARTVVNTWAGTTQWREAYRRIAFKPALQIAAALRKRDLDNADLDNADL